MRRAKIYFPILLLLLCGLAMQSVKAQDNTVKVNLERDDKPIDKGVSIRIYLDEQTYDKDYLRSKGLKLKVKQNTFSVPAEVMRQEKVARVIVEFGEYSLTFSNVPLAAFEAQDWTVGVDTKPISKENLMKSISEKDIDYASYLQFLNKDGKRVKILVN
jgi:hypothetical protein